MEYKTTRECAKEWNTSERRIQMLCATGRIPNALKFGSSWAIPKESKKPKDKRYKENKGELYDC